MGDAAALRALYCVAIVGWPQGDGKSKLMHHSVLARSGEEAIGSAVLAFQAELPGYSVGPVQVNRIPDELLDEALRARAAMMEGGE